jgi:hypothetical protein
MFQQRQTRTVTLTLYDKDDNSDEMDTLTRNDQSQNPLLILFHNVHVLKESFV